MKICPNCNISVEGDICPVCGRAAEVPTNPMHLAPGTLLSGTEGKTYRIDRPLGQGGFGVTYSAYDMTSNVKVAVKEYFPTRAAYRTQLKRIVPNPGHDEAYRNGMKSFLDEAVMLSAVGALSSIVGVMDYFESNGTAYIVMEFVEGVPLHAAMKTRGGKFSPSELLPMMPTLLSDLDILHRAGVIHRDISPDNLMITPNGRLKLIDFGSARSTAAGQAMTILLKTGFSPVEQYTSHGQGPHTDVYALAATVYYCLTGVIPPASADRIDTDELKTPNSLGAGLKPLEEQALLWGLNVQPKSRPKSMAVFKEALFPTPIAQPKPIPTKPISSVFGRVTSQKPLNDAPSEKVPTPHVKTEAADADATVQLEKEAEIPSDIGKTVNDVAPRDKIQISEPKKKLNLKMILLIAIPSVLALVLVIWGIVYISTHGTTSSGFKYEKESYYVSIIGYEGDGGDIVLPTEIDGKNVTYIEGEVFKGRTDISSITVDGQLSVWGTDRLLNGCSGLKVFYINGFFRNDRGWGSHLKECKNLRAIVLESREAYDSVIENRLFSELLNVAFCYMGQDTGHGMLRAVEVVDGIPYALTNLNYAVALMLPDGVSESVLPANIGSFPVVAPSGRVIGENDVSDNGNGDNSGNSGNSGNNNEDPAAPETDPVPTEVKGVTEDGFEYTISADRTSCTITGYNGGENVVVCPDEAEGVIIDKIGENAFAGNSEMISIYFPIYLTNIEKGAFKNCKNLCDLAFYSNITCSSDAFDNCDRLRAALIMEKNKMLKGCDVFDEITVFSYGMETGIGALEYIAVGENDVVYGVTSDKRACVMDIPSHCDEILLDEVVGDMTIEWMYEGALEDTVDSYIYMTPYIIIPYDLVIELSYGENDIGLDMNYDYYDYYSRAECWVMSCYYSAEFISLLDISGETSHNMISAAFMRAEELLTTPDHVRPDGRDWGTVLDDNGVAWEYTIETIGSYSLDSDSFESDLEAFAEQISSPVSEYNNEYYDSFGVGLTYNEDTEEIYVCVIAVIS